MAAGEGQPDTLKCNYLAPLASFLVQKDFFFMPETNNEDLSDVYSDSGSERDENSQNVVRWLESLPAEHQWYEAEEQIGRVESFEGAMYDGISTIGDTDAPITLKSLRTLEPRTENVETKKTSKHRKYRKGTLHANSTTTERTKRKKISLSRERCATSSKKSSTSSTKVPEVSNSRESREMKSPITCCRPNFRKPEVGRLLDTAMSMAINKYKRNDRTWESSGNNITETNEPPAKKSKPVEYIERKKTK